MLNLPEQNINKLITIIGEHHNIKIKCPEDKTILPVEGFVLLSNEVKTKVILELDEDNLENFHSFNILNVKNVLEIFPENITGNISTIYVDHRFKYLNKYYYLALYNNTKLNELANLPKEKIRDEYIKPYFEKTTKLLKVDDTGYSVLLYKFYKLYIDPLSEVFQAVNRDVEKWSSWTIPERIEYIKYLRILWAKVSDIYVLKNLFKLDDTLHFIILIGEAHYKNIVDFMSNYMCNIGIGFNSERTNCIKLFQEELKYISSWREDIYPCIKSDNLSIPITVKEYEMNKRLYKKLPPTIKN
jgi:hypothetical protein